MNKETAIFGGGCFWCTEAVFENLRGVISVTPGYAGGPSTGSGQAPTYESVCTGKTGHAEVIKIEFDPTRIAYKDLLTVFFATHDSTSVNRQGNDVGTQYRSTILYANEAQKSEAEKFIEKLNTSDPGGKRVVTELKMLEKFYEAENYHRQYYRNNSYQPYCQVIISPKVDKLQKEFGALLKSHDALGVS